MTTTTTWKARSDLVVRLVDACGSDRRIAHAAWVQHPAGPGDDPRDNPEGWRRVIKAMLLGRHGTPFEHGLMTVYTEAPAVVWWEWTRHRFMSLSTADPSFSLASARYKELEGEFYLPPDGRPCREPDGFKPMRPVLEADDSSRLEAALALSSAYAACWEAYSSMLAAGLAREVARLALGFGVYYAGYVSASPRTWLQFFSLRKNDPRSAAATFPQWEIEQVDEQCEALFARVWPVTYELFNAHGRVAG